MKYLLVNFDVALKHYEKATGVKEAFDLPEFDYTTLKIQKTLPTQGYHVWHVEHGKGFDNQKRALVFTIYLNDVKEGGETYFKHLNLKVKPETGLLLAWNNLYRDGKPNYKTMHEALPPIKGDKYVITKWWRSWTLI